MEERVLAYEDVYPLLYLKQRLCRGKKHKDIRHLVIDEMQDYSYLQYVILADMFSCKMTILGDLAQTIDSEIHDVLKFLPKIFGKKNPLRIIEMKDSYRNTLEIAKFAEKVSGVSGIKYLERHGKEVEETEFETMEAALEEILMQADLGPEGYETAAILTMTEKEAKEIYTVLKERREKVFYIDRDSTNFHKGITVTTYYMAKGLEFDQVFVMGGNPLHPFYSQYLYICATRALHELYVKRM